MDYHQPPKPTLLEKYDKPKNSILKRRSTPKKVFSAMTSGTDQSIKPPELVKNSIDNAELNFQRCTDHLELVKLSRNVAKIDNGMSRLEYCGKDFLELDDLVKIALQCPGMTVDERSDRLKFEQEIWRQLKVKQCVPLVLQETSAETSDRLSLLKRFEKASVPLFELGLSSTQITELCGKHFYLAKDLHNYHSPVKNLHDHGNITLVVEMSPAQYLAATDRNVIQYGHLEQARRYLVGTENTKELLDTPFLKIHSTRGLKEGRLRAIAAAFNLNATKIPVVLSMDLTEDRKRQALQILCTAAQKTVGHSLQHLKQYVSTEQKRIGANSLNSQDNIITKIYDANAQQTMPDTHADAQAKADKDRFVTDSTQELEEVADQDQKHKHDHDSQPSEGTSTPDKEQQHKQQNDEAADQDQKHKHDHDSQPPEGTSTPDKEQQHKQQNDEAADQDQKHKHDHGSHPSEGTSTPDQEQQHKQQNDEAVDQDQKHKHVHDSQPSEGTSTPDQEQQHKQQNDEAVDQDQKHKHVHDSQPSEGTSTPDQEQQHKQQNDDDDSQTDTEGDKSETQEDDEQGQHTDYQTDQEEVQGPHERSTHTIQGLSNYGDTFVGSGQDRSSDRKMYTFNYDAPNDSRYTNTPTDMVDTRTTNLDKLDGNNPLISNLKRIKVKRPNYPLHSSGGLFINNTVRLTPSQVPSRFDNIPGTTWNNNIYSPAAPMWASNGSY
jgi:hypothetical protein